MKYRWIDMSDDLFNDLLGLWKNRKFKESPYVFVYDNPISAHHGKPFTARRKFIKGICKRAGVKKFGFHALRRFVASVLADEKVPLKKVQMVLGHAALHTTERYVAHLSDDLKSTMATISGRLNREIENQEDSEQFNQ